MNLLLTQDNCPSFTATCQEQGESTNLPQLRFYKTKPPEALPASHHKFLSGIQLLWIPAFAGMTMLIFSELKLLAANLQEPLP